MTLLDRLAQRLGYTKTPLVVPDLIRATGLGQMHSLPDYSLAENQEGLYQRLSWVYSAVDKVAQVGAGVALNVKKRTGEDITDIPNHPFEVLLLRPNPLQSRSEFMYATIAYRCLTGNAYWYLNRRNANQEPAELWVIPSHMIQPIPDGRSFIRGYEYRPGLGQDPIILETWQVAHSKSFHPLNWYVGLSPIEAIAIGAEADLKAQAWNRNFFSKDNAKPAGAIAFADPIPNTTWEEMQEKVRRDWGGTQRSGPMMLRNVGKGGVEYLAMALSQKDMEFLQARQFTKEEIYSIFAPGLASMIAVNATEANARTGKATFTELAVWPALVNLAEKITNDLLPVYGPDLMCEFEDIRVTDRAMELQEQAEYAKVHTIDEIRAKYYEDQEIGDDRGLLLPAQVGPGTPMPGTELEPEPPPAPVIQQVEQTDDVERTEEQTEDEPEEAPEQEEAQAREEIKTWRRYAAKHGRAKALEFQPDHIAADVQRVIKARILAACCEHEVKAAFIGPF